MVPFGTIAHLIRMSVSKTTHDNRHRLLRRLPQDPDVSSFVETVDRYLADRARLTAGTRLKDTAAAKFWAARVLPASDAAQVVSLLQDVAKGLRKQQVDEISTSAAPLTPLLLMQLLTNLGAHPDEPYLKWLCSLDKHITAHHSAPVPYAPFRQGARLRFTWPMPALLILLTFRTASRLGEVALLERRDVRLLSQALLVVSFRVSKTNPEGQPRPDHQVAIAQPGPLTQLACSADSTRIFSEAHVTTARQALRRTRPDVQLLTLLSDNRRYRHHLSDHSIKKGAALLLFFAGAAGTLQPSQISHMLKHATFLSSMAYCPVTAWAAILGSPPQTL